MAFVRYLLLLLDRLTGTHRRTEIMLRDDGTWKRESVAEFQRISIGHRVRSRRRSRRRMSSKRASFPSYPPIVLQP